MTFVRNQDARCAVPVVDASRSGRVRSVCGGPPSGLARSGPPRFILVHRFTATLEPAGVSTGTRPGRAGVRSTPVYLGPTPTGPARPRRTALAHV